MSRVVSGPATAGLHGFPAALTSFVGRAGEVAEVAGLVDEFRLVTVTGPGGVGKTRLAAEVARREAGSFADGVWLVEFARVQEATLVQATVATALGLQQAPGMSILDSLIAVLARQQLLLVVDNCEHVLGAAAELCGAVLGAADDVRILATSRELMGVAGEARYRLPPLTLPRPGDQGELLASEAVILFADRARQFDPHFTMSRELGPLVSQLVQRLDGMPLAIELAAARVEALGAAQLLDRLDDRFRLLVGGDRLATARQQSLVATVDWSYQLLSDHEQRVFRQLAIFTGPFTLEAAEAVAGARASDIVLHLVDCSLVAPPRTGPDGRARYVMLESLRAYGADRLAEGGEQDETAAGLASYALQVAEQAAADLETSDGEAAAAGWLDAEDANVHQALAWAVDNDPASALRIACALAPWWLLRGRATAGYDLLSAASEHVAQGGHAWCTAQVWLGYLSFGPAMIASLEHFTASRDALIAGSPSPLLVRALNGRARCLVNLHRLPEAADDARQAVALARELGYAAGEGLGLYLLAGVSQYQGDYEGALASCRQVQQVAPADLPASIARRRAIGETIILIEAGEFASAGQACSYALDSARRAGDLKSEGDCLSLMADLEERADRFPEATAHLREATRLALQTGEYGLMFDCLEVCGYLCAATQRWSQAVTLWAAYAAYQEQTGIGDLPQDVRRRQEPLQAAREALGPVEAQAAEQRGAAMTLTTAAEFVTLLLAADTQQPNQPNLPRLSAREQELVTLVARGRTDAEIAAQLYISVRTVRSHLDRIRDKSGCRRRADLTRLALQIRLV